MIKILALLILAFSYSADVQAETRDLNLIYIDGYHALPLKRLPEVLSIANHYFTEVDVSFKIKLMTEPDPCPLFHNLPMRLAEMTCFSKDARTSGYTRKSSLTYYMLPPYREMLLGVNGRDTSIFYIAGMAEWVGGAVAMGNAEEVNQDDQPRIWESATILAHEILHLEGARHNDSKPNLMHSNALAYVHSGEWLSVLKSTKRQIRRFLRR